jgi:undecaprenyl-diphosphatase
VHHLSYLQAITVGLLQGVTELFPVSSLGHSVLVPALIGGSWHRLVTEQTQGDSPYLAFIVGLHVATGLALLCFFWRDWVRLVGAFFRSIGRRKVSTVDERMAWLLVIATIPAGIAGIALEHALRTLFAKPVAAAAFLTANGVLLFAGERLRRRSAGRVAVGAVDGPGAAHVDTLDRDPADRDIVAGISQRDAFVIGVFQTLALLAGVSRSGITMVAGLLRGLDHEQAVRFAFLLATPIIFAAGIYKLPELAGPLGSGIRMQVLAGAVAAFVGAIVSIRFLTRYFRTRTLTPFAIYCVGFGIFCLAYFG